MQRIFESNKLYIAFIITSVVIVIYSLITQFIFGETIFKLISSIWPNLVLSICILNLSIFFRYLRWRYLLFSIGLRPNLKRDIINWMASFAFIATPGKIGELVRINFYKKDFNISRSKIFSILAIEKVSDLISITLVCILSLNSISVINYRLLIYSFLLISLVFFLICKNKSILLNSIKLFFPKINNKSLSHIYISFKEASKINVFFISLSIGSFGWFIECFSIYKLLSYLKGYNFSFFQASFAHTASSLVGLISLIPGGIAATEFTTSKILMNYGLQIDNAIIYSFLIRLITIWYATIIGLFIFFLRIIKQSK